MYDIQNAALENSHYTSSEHKALQWHSCKVQPTNHNVSTTRKHADITTNRQKMDFQLNMLQELYLLFPKLKLAQNQESWLKPGAKYSSSSKGWFVLLKLVYQASTTCSYSPTLIKSFSYLISLSSTSLLSLFMSHLCQIVLSSQQSSCLCVNSQISLMMKWNYSQNSAQNTSWYFDSTLEILAVGLSPQPGENWPKCH